MRTGTQKGKIDQETLAENVILIFQAHSHLTKVGESCSSLYGFTPRESSRENLLGNSFYRNVHLNWGRRKAVFTQSRPPQSLTGYVPFKFVEHNVSKIGCR